MDRNLFMESGGICSDEGIQYRTLNLGVQNDFTPQACSTLSSHHFLTHNNQLITGLSLIPRTNDLVFNDDVSQTEQVGEATSSRITQTVPQLATHNQHLLAPHELTGRGRHSWSR